MSAAAVEAVAAAARPWAHLRAIAAREPAAGPARSPRSSSWSKRSVRRRSRARRCRRSRARRRPLSRTGPPRSPPRTASGRSSRPSALDDLWAAEADAAAAGDGAGSDGAGPLEVFDSLLLLAETYPDPATYLRTWDRLLADEEAHAGVADDTLAREESEDDRVVIGTIHAAKGREYDSVVIPDYDCDVSRWAPPQVEEERRVVYVGVTRARDAALFTVDTSAASSTPSCASWSRSRSRASTTALERLAGRGGRRRAARAHRRPPRGDRGAVPGAGAGGTAPAGRGGPGAPRTTRAVAA